MLPGFMKALNILQDAASSAWLLPAPHPAFRAVLSCSLRCAKTKGILLRLPTWFRFLAHGPHRMWL